MRLHRKALSLLIAGSLALSGGGLAPGPAAASAHVSKAAGGRPLEVRVGQAKGLTHIAFPGAQPRVAWEGKALVLTFAHAGDSGELARLKIDPTQLVQSVTSTQTGESLQLRLTPADGVVVKVGREEGAAMISLLEAPKTDAAPAPAPPKQDQRPNARPDPVPADGRVRLQAAQQGRNLVLTFPWRAPLGAAVFRRGAALWIVFDAKAAIDLSGAPRVHPQYQSMQALQGEDYVAVRLIAPTVQASASAELATWKLTIGPDLQEAPDTIKISQDDQNGAAALKAEVAGGTGVFWVADPDAGDKIAVVTALAPAKGVPVTRRLVDAEVLSSSQGLALTPLADDLAVTTDGDVARISRPRGLALSAAAGGERRDLGPDLGLPQPAALPALVDFNGWSKTGAGGFVGRYDQLQTLAATEAGKGRGGGVAARLGLARFLIGSEMAFEAIGVLELAGKADQTLAGAAEFRGLRGAARAMAGRFKDAQADFSSPVLADDPASSLWRGYIAERLGDHVGAHQQFILGRTALPMFAERWRARFALMDAQAALGANDVASARNQAAYAGALSLDPLDALALKLVNARLLEAAGQIPQALDLYDQVASNPYGAVSAPAELRAVELRLRLGKISSTDAEARLDSLRFRWRGDATELETVRALGQLYLQQGRYRDALDALRSANGRLPDLPTSVNIAKDLADAFKALFLEGRADGLQPIQALGLFYDFKELTPIGADGDEMVRRLARRLVDVDLLEQAAELMKYQVDNRLDGVPKAEVATDLAMIDLMDKRPEDALDAINGSRSTLLPTALNARRRMLEARAHIALGRYDAALELIQQDKTAEADELRADIAWRQKNWAAAGPRFEAELGERWKNPAPLTADEQGALVRAGTAYTLAGDDKSLARLRAHYQRLAETSSAPNALKVALEGLDGERLSPDDFNRITSQNAVFAGWLAEMKRRFAAEPSPFSGGGFVAKAPDPPAAAPPARPSARKSRAPARLARRGPKERSETKPAAGQGA